MIFVSSVLLLYSHFTVFTFRTDYIGGFFKKNIPVKFRHFFYSVYLNNKSNYVRQSNYKVKVDTFGPTV